MAPQHLQGAKPEEEWIPYYMEEPGPIEATEAYQIYENFGILVGVTNPATGNDYLLDWLNNYGNQSSYENIKKLVGGYQNSIDTFHLRHIRMQQNLVVDLKRQYAELTQRLEDVMQGRTAAQNEIDNLNNFLDPHESDMIRELSPYDDTSAIDTVMEVPAGREHPIRLTTKVAQQWYKRFAKVLKRGNRDVRNYGPFIGGTPFYRPSLQKTILFDGNNYGQPVQGIPFTIVDQQMLDERSNSFSDLSNKVDQWKSFGIPQPMGEWGQTVDGKEVNQYGYINGGTNSGGSHVSNYTEFLELFGLGPENSLKGGWPKPSDTPMFTQSKEGPRGGGGGFGFGALVGAAVSLVVPGSGLIGGAILGVGATWIRRKFGGEEKRKFENKPWQEILKTGPGDSPALESFTMMDEYGNIVCPNIFGFGSDPYVQSGWSIQSGGQLVYLYPDWDNAIAYNEGSVEGKAGNPWIPHGHGYVPSGYYMNYKGGVNGNRNGPYGKDGNPDEWRVGEAADNMNKFDDAWDEITKVRDSRNSLSKYGGANELHGGEYTYHVPGPRLDAGDHNPNLTIHEKRALVISRNSTKHRFMPLGRSNPKQDGSWSREHKQAALDVGKTAQQARLYGAYSSYKNPRWPYGTGWYWKRDEWGDRIYGSKAPPISGPKDMSCALKEVGMAALVAPGLGQAVLAAKGLQMIGVLPDSQWGSNYGMYIGDLLIKLPHRGQFTIINNDDHSPTTIDYDGTIRNGKELNVGFVDFVARELIHLGVKNRRIGSRWDDGKMKPYTIASHSWKDALYALFGENPADNYRIVDTTYGDLFGPEGGGDNDGSDDGTGGTLDFADFSQKIIKSVAEIPIRREVVDNLLNKTNENMSLMQFMQNIMHPSALGVSTGSIYTMIRPAGGDGHFEVVQGSKDWSKVGKKVRDEIKRAEEEGASGLDGKRFPEEVMLFDYKAEDSLIKSIDMSSKFDPGIAGTFERSAAQISGGTKTELMKFLSYGNIALDLQEFLQSAGPEENPELYKDVIRVDEGDVGSVHVDWTRVGAGGAENAEKIAVPDSVFTKFLMQDPDRMTKLIAVIQTDTGNWSTDLLANYMRGCTITMHGTCNIKPFNYIYVTGVLPNMKGVYMVHNVRDSVTPQDFDTIIEAVLIQPNPEEKNIPRQDDST